MKVLITSPDAIFSKKPGNFIPGVEEALDEFQKQGGGVLVVSVRAGTLAKVPKKYTTRYCTGKERKGKALVDLVLENLKGTSYQDIMVLGAKEDDYQLAANNKIVLLTAGFAKENNPESDLYEKGYGINFSDGASLRDFFQHFLQLENPWYYRLPVGKKTTVYALTSANTLGSRSASAKTLSERFQRLLKEGDKSYREVFRNYFLLCLGLIPEIREVDIWATYPSSSGTPNSDLDFFKKAARESYNSKSQEPLFIRHKPTYKRHEKSATERKRIGCRDQLDTIHLNPVYRGKLEGRTVCVIDDFTTYGTSCETIRALLLAAGVEKIIFIAMGKFGYEYCGYLHEISGDIYSPGYTVVEKAKRDMAGYVNSKSDTDFLKSLGDIVK